MPVAEMVKETSLLMDIAEVRSILSGDRTQFRVFSKDGLSPHGDAGDLIWIRESFLHDKNRGKLLYRADYGEPESVSIAAKYSDRGTWRPSIHMGKWASRIQLEITDVKIQFIRETTDLDAIAEGHRFATCAHCQKLTEIYLCGCDSPTPMLTEAFKGLLEIQHENEWRDNALMWVYRFRRMDA